MAQDLYTIRTGVIELHARSLELPLLVRFATLFILPASEGLIVSFFSA